MIPLELALGFGIGLSLGLLGGGGSILTVPALVYLVGQTPQAAVTTSLAIVGANSLMGAMFHRAQGTLDWKVALTFGGAGMLAARQYTTGEAQEFEDPLHVEGAWFTEGITRMDDQQHALSGLLYSAPIIQGVKPE